MPDKTHYDLETLILMVIAMLNPMVAVFMMKGCGGQFVICLLLFITLYVSLISLSFPIHLLTLNLPASSPDGSTPMCLSPIVTRERRLACLLSLGFLERLPSPRLSNCKGLALYLLLFRLPSTSLNQYLWYLHLQLLSYLHPHLRLQLQLQSKWLWSQKHLTHHHLHLLLFQFPLQIEHELWRTIDDTTAL
jgi:uncharacterized membrane protein YqaE (UPF0057 family)